MRARTTTVALVCAVLALTACSDGGDDSADSPTTATATPDGTATPTDAGPDGTSSPTVTPTGDGTASPTDGTDGTDAPDPEGTDEPNDPRCRRPDVRVALRDLESAPGRRYAEVVLTNAGGQACTVQGYGGLQLLDADRNPVPTRLVRLESPAPRAVRLEPGDAAVSRISFSVVATDRDRRRGTCQPEASFALVTAPDERRSTRVPWNLGPVCDRGRIEQTAYAAD